MSLLGLGLVVVAAPAAAATFTVTNGDDSGAGSFRQALADASADAAGPAVIDFDPGLSVTLTSGQAPQYSGILDLTINGNGSTIDAGVTGDSLRSTQPDVALTVNNLTLTAGISSFSQSAITARGNVSVNGSVFRNNMANGPLGGNGGAISTLGSVVVSGSTFTDNGASGDGGAISAKGNVSVTTSTFSPIQRVTAAAPFSPVAA